MKVLVTGASGFLGVAVVRHLVNAGYSVKAMVHKKSNSKLFSNPNIDVTEGDVTAPDTIEKAISGCQIVMHLASVYMFYPWWEKKATDLYKINVEGTSNVCSMALKHRVARFIFTSSVASMGKKLNSHYARSKFLAESEVLKFCKKGLAALILNPAIMIGEGDYKPTPSGKIIVNFLNQRYPGYFDCVLSIADVDDVAKAHVNAIEKGRIGQRYILCNKEHYSLKELFRSLEEISGIKAPKTKIPFLLLLSFVCLDELLSYFVFNKKPLMPSEGLKFCRTSTKLDNSDAVKELNYTTTPVKETLTKAINWYTKNGYIKNA